MKSSSCTTNSASCIPAKGFRSPYVEPAAEPKRGIERLAPEQEVRRAHLAHATRRAQALTNEEPIPCR